jgi:hypothetical protein
VQDLAKALIRLLDAGKGDLEVCALHQGLYDEVPVTAVKVMTEDGAPRWVVLS